jgi:hypothetical protein
MELITLNDASQISGKSIQTIRRMIKQKKVHVKKQKTPQGFNYLVIKESLAEYMNSASQTLTSQDSQPGNQQEDSINQVPVQGVIQDYSRDHRAITQTIEDTFHKELGQFNSTLQKLIDQNEKDKSNFFQLIKTFQDRVVILENQIKQLEAPQAGWWQFWK